MTFTYVQRERTEGRIVANQVSGGGGEALTAYLRAAAEAAEPLSLDLGPLEEAAESFAVARRARGELPERMIVALKAHVREAELPDLSDDHRALGERVVSWAIRAYYAPPSAAPSRAGT